MWWSKTKYADCDNQTLMVRGQSRKRLFYRLLIWLRCFEISVLFGLILGSVCCAVFWLLGATCDSACVRASRESDVVIGDSFILALRSLACWWWPSAQQLLSLWCPLTPQQKVAQPLTWELWGEYSPGAPYSLSAHPRKVEQEKMVHYALSTHHRSGYSISVHSQLLRQGHQLLPGKRTPPQWVMLLLHWNMQLSLRSTWKTCWRKLPGTVGWAGRSAGCTDGS